MINQHKYLFFGIFIYIGSIFSADIYEEQNNYKTEIKTVYVNGHTTITLTITERDFDFNYVFSLKLNDQEIAYLNCDICDTLIYIALFKVLPEYRKSGHGHFLLNFACEHLIAQGAQEIYLIARPFDLPKGQSPDEMMPKLIKFYNNNGFIALNEVDYNTLYHAGLLIQQTKSLISNYAKEVQLDEIKNELESAESTLNKKALEQKPKGYKFIKKLKKAFLRSNL